MWRTLAMARVTVLVVLAAWLAMVGSVPTHLRDALHSYETLHLHALSRSTRQRRALDGTPYETNHFRFTAFNRTFELDMHRDDSLFLHGIEARSMNAAGEVVPFEVDVHNYLRGTVKGHDNSEASLYMHESGGLHGHFRAGADVFFIEPAQRHFNGPHQPQDGAEAAPAMVLYNLNDVKPEAWHPKGWSAPSEDHHHDGSSHGEDQPSFCGNGHAAFQELAQQASAAYQLELSPEHRSRRAAASSTANTCLMRLVADYRFFTQQGSSTAATINTMVGLDTSLLKLAELWLGCMPACLGCLGVGGRGLKLIVLKEPGSCNRSSDVELAAHARSSTWKLQIHCSARQCSQALTLIRLPLSPTPTWASRFRLSLCTQVRYPTLTIQTPQYVVVCLRPVQA